MNHHAKRTSYLPLVLLVATAGCSSVGSVATFPGIKTPVLLGPKDRIGGATASQPATKVRGFETEAFWTLSQSNESSSTEWTTKLALPHAAREAAGGDDGVDIHLTDVMPAAYVVLCGVKSKNYVTVEGDVVRPQMSGGGSK
jgi:hypothetical protein